MGILGKVVRKGASCHSNVSSKRTRTGRVLVPSRYPAPGVMHGRGSLVSQRSHMNEGMKVEEYGGAGTEARRHSAG